MPFLVTLFSGVPIIRDNTIARVTLSFATSGLTHSLCVKYSSRGDSYSEHCYASLSPLDACFPSQVTHLTHRFGYSRDQRHRVT